MAFRVLVRKLSLACAAAASLPFSPLSADPIRVEPTGQWQVLYEDWDCVLRRDVTVGGAPGYLKLSIEPMNPLASFWIAAKGKGTEMDGGLTVFLDGKRVTKPVPYSAFSKDGEWVRAFDLNIVEQHLDSFQGSLRLLTRADEVDARLDKFQPAWAALNKCMVDLYQELGVTKSDLSQIAKAPEGSTFWYIDRPRVPYLNIALFYWITAEGRAEKCQVLKPSGYADFDASVCRRIEMHARYTPARNAAGERIRTPHYEHDRMRPMVIHAPG